MLPVFLTESCVNVVRYYSYTGQAVNCGKLINDVNVSIPILTMIVML